MPEPGPGPEGLPRDVVEAREAIGSMKIRGAGLIARAAAQALASAAMEFGGDDLNEFMGYMEGVSEYLRSARPTAVSLPNAISYVMFRLRRANPGSVEEARSLVIRISGEFVEYSKRAVDEIGELGSKRLKNGDVIMTHCHSSVATSVLAAAHRAGKVNRVYVKETRPRLQGLIAARQLADAGLDIVLIPDSAVRYFMKDVDKVVVGADAVAANGAVVNKIGTSVVALAAKEARVNFYVAAETYKFSPRTLTGELVPIEFRSPTEIVDNAWAGAHPRVKVLNPVFDVTPPEYIDAVITEKGVIAPHAAPLILIEEYGVRPGMGDLDQG